MKVNGKEIRLLIKKRDLNQKKIAEDLEMNEGAFSAALTRGGISDERAAKLARMLSVDIFEITSIESTVEEPAPEKIKYTKIPEETYFAMIERLRELREKLKHFQPEEAEKKHCG